MKWKEISHHVDDLEMFVKEKKGTWIKSHKKLKKETEVFAFPEDMDEASKVDDGTRTRIKKGLKQLRSARDEEKTAKELQESGKDARAGAAIGRELVEGDR